MNAKSDPLDTLTLRPPSSGDAGKSDSPKSDSAKSGAGAGSVSKGGWLQMFPKEIQSWAAQGVHFEYSSRDDALRIEGFYKFGPIRLDIRGSSFVAVDKRGEETVLKNFDDLVKLNYNSWRLASKGRNPPEPDKMFLEAFLKRSLVRRNWIYQPNEESED